MKLGSFIFFLSIYTRMSLRHHQVSQACRQLMRQVATSLMLHLWMSTQWLKVCAEPRLEMRASDRGCDEAAYNG